MTDGSGGGGGGTSIVPREGNGAPGAGMTRTDGIGGGSLARAAETASSASAAMARAHVEARFVMARANPRDIDETRVRILKECRRPGFAEVARYSIPRGGKKIEGPSIRLAEVCARYLGNLEVASPVVYEDDDKRLVRCSVTDLESNATYSADLAISKTVERRNADKLDPSQILGTRRNSFGDVVYIVRASDDELLQKHNALVSKTIRTLIFRIVPGDIVDEAEDVAIQTLRSRDTADPDGARKKLVDAFAAMNVMPNMLKELIGHDVGTCAPAEIQELRQVYVALKEGHATWTEIMTGKKKADADAAAGAEAGGKPAPNTRTGRAREAAAKAAGRGRDEVPAGASATAPHGSSAPSAPDTGELSAEEERSLFSDE